MRWWAPVVAVLLLAYPLLVYWGMQWLEPRFIGLVLVLVYAVRGLAISTTANRRALILGGVLLAAAFFWWSNSETGLKLVPVVINLALALGFGWTLWHPPTLPARMAQLQHGFITPAIKSYTDRITVLWVGFFCLNATLALVTALWMSRESWALYNGLIAYGLIGLMFLGEYSYRRLVFFKQHNL